MFTGFTDETVQFFLDLKFHNNSEYFHDNHDRYVEAVQTPFYEFIEDLGPAMQQIDPQMEIRPYKCLSRIHRDTRFSRDKSPYRDHHWLLFRRQAEPREKSVMFWFEFGPDRLSWGMGVWGENRELFDLMRKKIRANPVGIQSLIDDLDLGKNKLAIGGTFYKKMEVPAEIPPLLKQIYTAKELYISKIDPAYEKAFSKKIIKDVRKDFMAIAPLYRLLRGYTDEIQQTGKE
jgi:uncharacterized protein (TIGR02453 family)